ncbi:MAG: sugar transferase [Thermodesulforhabdaceae bacterium]
MESRKRIFFVFFKWLNIVSFAVLFICILHLENSNNVENFGFGSRLLDVLIFLVAIVWWEVSEKFAKKERIIFEQKPISLLVPNFVSGMVLAFLSFVFLVLMGVEFYRSIYISLISGVILFGLLTAYDYTLGWILNRFVTSCPMVKRILVVGTGARAISFIDKIRKNQSGCYTVPVVLDVEKRESFWEKNFSDITFIAESKLLDILRHQVVDEVYVFLPVRSYYDLITEVVKECMIHGIPVKVSPVMDVESLTYKLDIKTMLEGDKDGSVWIKTGSSDLEDPFYVMLKRMFDVIVAWLLVIVLSPVMLCATIAVKYSSPGPVIFKQKRVGKGKRIFTLYKFRTMYEDAEARLAELESSNETKGAAFKMVNDPRITPVGRFLRKTSIDELPQLFNVIKGEMSLVGPRPLPLRDYERFYDDRHWRRFTVIPGITGLWQVSGRSNMKFDDWMALDLFYIDNWSLWLDLLILWKTFGVVLKGSGAM